MSQNCGCDAILGRQGALYLEDGVVLPGVLGVIALQQAATHRGARTSELRHVEVSKTQLGAARGTKKRANGENKKDRLR